MRRKKYKKPATHVVQLLHQNCLLNGTTVVPASLGNPDGQEPIEENWEDED